MPAGRQSLREAIGELGMPGIQSGGGAVGRQRFLGAAGRLRLDAGRPGVGPALALVVRPVGAIDGSQGRAGGQVDSHGGEQDLRARFAGQFDDAREPVRIQIVHGRQAGILRAQRQPSDRVHVENPRIASGGDDGFHGQFQALEQVQAGQHHAQRNQPGAQPAPSARGRPEGPTASLLPM